ncbi:MAG: RluA family pseudouridine synthase [Firmicutes bacterium]|nr:RluA family pseudouridine synthase [Bacillota bacterium]
MSAATLLNIKIPSEWKGGTIASFLRVRMGLSRRTIRALKREAGIRINGEVAPVWRRLTGGEELELRFTPAKQSIIPEEIPLAVIYEDQDLTIIDKPPGMLVHPVKKFQSGTLANALLFRWRAAAESSSFHPVHRLDRLTSGLVLVAKNPWIHQQLSLQLASGKMSRLYLAFCKGNLPRNSGKIDAPIKEQTASALRIIETGGKPAVTRYRVIAKTEYSTLAAVKLYTGRTHQIRVHLSHLQCPIWGDPLYGIPERDLPRPALHAVKLTFEHPRSGKRLIVKSELPADLKKLAVSLGLFSSLI